MIEEQQGYLERLEDLMTDKNTIDLRYLKIFLVGPPRVGKTTTLNRLLKIFENILSAEDRLKCRSTLLVNCIQVLVFLADNAAEWLSSEDVEEEIKLLFSYFCGVSSISDKVSIDVAGQASQQAPYPEANQVLGQNELSPAHTECSQSQPTSIDNDTEYHLSLENEQHTNTQHQTTSEQYTNTQHQTTSCQPNRLLHIKDRLRKLIAAGDYSKMTRLLGNTLLNINDIGGQPGFLEMLPALSTGPAIYLVFLDLSKDIHKSFKIPFSRDDKIITPYEAKHTVQALISQILSAIASVHCTSQKLDLPPDCAAHFSDKFEKFQRVGPVAALVGTHKDKLDDPQSKIKQIDEILRKTVQSFHKIILSPSSSNPCFFPVDNYSGSEESDIGPLRKFMNNIFNTHFKDASLPIRPKWLIFGVLLRREYKIVNIDDCLEIGKLLDMDEDDVRFCIWYLNCIGTLMHYTNIADDDGWFKNHVICSPQVVFDSISKLIVVSLCTLHFENYVIEGERAELIKKGQFSIESIEKYCLDEEVSEKLKRDELVPVSQLVKLLNHANLLSSIIHKEPDGSERITYLMPAVLECALPNELNKPTKPDESNPEPLYITFSCGFIPTGSFCGLITKLISKGPKGIFGLEWDIVEDGVKRNCVSFYIDFVNQVTLICHDSCYEIRVTRNSSAISLHDLCTHVLSVILHILKILYKDLVPQIAFQCPCPKHSDSRDTNSLCVLVVGNVTTEFCCERQPISLRCTQQVWMGKVTLTTLAENK